MDTSGEGICNYLNPQRRRAVAKALDDATLGDLHFRRIFDPLMCRILQLDALLCEDGLWDPDRADDLKSQIAARQDDLERLYRTHGLLLDEYR